MAIPLGLTGAELTRARILEAERLRKEAELTVTPTSSSGETPPLQTAPTNYPDYKPRPNKISNLLPKVNKLALTSHYLVKFGGLNKFLREYLEERGVGLDFIGEDAGLLCSSAFIPGSSHATSDITGNVATGVVEKIAHTRIFAPIDLEFYVDRDYKMMKFMEHWIEFISGAGPVSQTHRGYHFRMNYPDEYKVDQTRIIKFERDYRNELTYNFFGMFPLDMASIPVSYDSSQIFKVRVTFNYERYTSGYSDSLSEARGISNNREPGAAALGGTLTLDPSEYLVDPKVFSGEQPPIKGPQPLQVQPYRSPNTVDPNSRLANPLF